MGASTPTNMIKEFISGQESTAEPASSTILTESQSADLYDNDDDPFRNYNEELIKAIEMNSTARCKMISEAKQVQLNQGKSDKIVTSI